MAKVGRLISKEGWKVNVPKTEEILELWKPAPKLTIETDPVFIRCVSEQSWSGLAVKDFGPEQGLGESTFHLTCKARKRRRKH